MPLVGDARPVEDMTDDDGLALAAHAARWVLWRCLRVKAMWTAPVGT